MAAWLFKGNSLLDMSCATHCCLDVSSRRWVEASQAVCLIPESTGTERKKDNG